MNDIFYVLKGRRYLYLHVHIVQLINWELEQHPSHDKQLYSFGIHRYIVSCQTASIYRSVGCYMENQEIKILFISNSRIG